MERLILSERETLRKLDQILKKLDQILRVLSAQAASQSSLTERARLLKIAGLDNVTIAEVLNTTPGTIRVMTSHLRRES
jgi:DNA-binding NarL/FixJ family response regulator